MRARAQALVEMALVAPLVILLCGVVFNLGVAALNDQRLQITVSEAARVAAQGRSASEAAISGMGRGSELADNQRLQGVSLSVDTSNFRRGGTVRVDGTMTVSLIPALGVPSVVLHRWQVETIDPLRNLR